MSEDTMSEDTHGCKGLGEQPTVMRLGGSGVGQPQAYLPKHYCWNGRSIQAATAVRDEMLAFLHDHPYMRVFSALRIGDVGDHRCGFAYDLVPLTTNETGRKATYAAHDAAVKSGKYAYVEPVVWLPNNKHLHISFRRCPK